MKQKMLAGLSLLSFGLLVLSFQNCAPQHSAVDNSSSGGSNEVPAPALESVAADLLENRCASCHSGTPSAGDPVGDVLNVDQLTALGHLVPGDPGASSLYLVIVDGSMPPGQPFTLDERDVIFQWIQGLQ